MIELGLDYDKLRIYAESVVMEYRQTAPVVAAYADWLYIALNEEQEKVTLKELILVGRLYEDGEWLHPNLAANLVYKLLDLLGRDTRGMLGF